MSVGARWNVAVATWPAADTVVQCWYNYTLLRDRDGARSSTPWIVSTTPTFRFYIAIIKQ